MQYASQPQHKLVVSITQCAIHVETKTLNAGNVQGHGNQRNSMTAAAMLSALKHKQAASNTVRQDIPIFWRRSVILQILISTIGLVNN